MTFQPRDASAAGLPPLTICLTVDTDEDSYDKEQFAEMGATWRGMDEGVPALLDATAGLRDGNGAGVRITWYVRCDGCIETLMGSARWVLDTYSELWRDRERLGDELGWHIHLFEDVAEVVNSAGSVQGEKVEARLNAARLALGDDIDRMRSSRIGHAFFSDAVGSALVRMGLKVDSSAMPGRCRRDGHIYLDWEPTPRMPYRPSCLDYRVSGRPHIDLLEVPFTMIPTLTSYDRAPVMRYADLAFRPDIVRDGLLRVANDAALLVAIVHPSEILASREHELVAFSPNAVCENIEVVLRECDRIGRPVLFSTLSKAAEVFQVSDE